MSRFIIYKPTPDDVAEAFRRSEALGSLRTSFTNGKGNMTGFLGEVAFENTFKQFDYVGDNSFTHDYEYKGLKVDHANGWDANKYHQRQEEYAEKPAPKRIKPQPLGQLKNVVRPQPKAPEAKQTSLYDHQLEQAKMKDWRNRGLSNNKIIDN